MTGDFLADRGQYLQISPGLAEESDLRFIGACKERSAKLCGSPRASCSWTLQHVHVHRSMLNDL